MKSDSSVKILLKYGDRKLGLLLCVYIKLYDKFMISLRFHYPETSISQWRWKSTAVWPDLWSYIIFHGVVPWRYDV